MLYIIPITPIMSIAIVTPNTAKRVNSVLISFFWHAAPAHRFVFLLPSLLVRMMVRLHLHWKQDLLEPEALQVPWPLQELVALLQDSREVKQLGKRRGRVVFDL